MAKGDFNYFSGSANKDERVRGTKDVKTAGLKDFLQKQVDKQLNKMTKEGKTPFGTPVGGSAVGEDGLGRFGNPNKETSFFSPSGNEVGQIASATTDLSGLNARNYVSGDVSDDKEGFNNYLRNNYDTDMDDARYKNMGGQFQRILRESYNEDKLKYKEDGQLLNKAPTDTKVASAFSAGSGLFGNDIDVGDGVFRTKDQIIKMRDYPGKFNLEPGSRLFKQIQDAGRGLVNAITGTQPVAAGTLDAQPKQVGYQPVGPKLNYVNPDAKTMTMSQIGEALKPKNLFGYKDKFGRYDDPGSPLARDREQTIQRVAQNFSSPIVGDARSIAQIRADQQERMRENARLRDESFQRGERVKQKSADVTYNTGMYSNPAYGFSGKMSPEAQKKYAESARYATEAARPDPSLGNVMMSGINKVSGFFGGPQGSLESIGERQLRLANKEINRPTYQKEAYARKFLGITNDQLKARNLQQIRENAKARNQAFQSDRVQRAVEKAAIRRGGNIGTGRDGGFGLGTTGQGMPSNPKGFSGYSRKSSPGTGTGTGTGKSSGRGGISKSTSRGQGGGPSSRSRGGTSKGGSKAKSSGSRGQGGGPSSRSKGGSFGGSRKSNTGRKASKASKSRTGRSRSQCDIRTKIDISQLTNQNLIKDDLAAVAYFVQELRGE